MNTKPRECLAPLSHFDKPPSGAVPAGAADCHAHVLGPFEHYPLGRDLSYMPPPSPLPRYLDMLEQTGMTRGVLVQPSCYGTDNRLVLDAVSAHKGRLRAVVVIDETITEAEVARMHGAGARGFRINLLFRGGVPLEAIDRVAAVVRPFGWHAQLLIDIRTLEDEAVSHRLAALPVPLVFDHMGHFPCELGCDWAGFGTMVGWAKEGRAWIKVSGGNRVAAPDDIAEGAGGIARHLVQRIPERLVWGSDWPHVGFYDVMPDTGHLLNLALAWMGSAKRRILVDNAATLYDFD